MKTTIELPDDLIRAVKMRAVAEDRKLKDVMAELLEKGLAKPSRDAGPVRHRVEFPIVRVAHPAPPGEELTPERMKEILLQEEVDHVLGR